ncbi:MAG: peptidoglycan-binding protein [Comamonadaceae bacterium]|nr:peptidoglycan-binding protein [Comamonadaceae bacterium]
MRCRIIGGWRRTPAETAAAGAEAGAGHALCRQRRCCSACWSRSATCSPRPRRRRATTANWSRRCRRFQHRHGLAADGVVGAATLRRAAGQPVPRRVRQIELTLERLRWTPLLQGPRMIVVNIPEFVLRAYEVRDGRIDVAADDEGHRRQGAGHAHAAVRRGHALHRVQPVLERAAVDRRARNWCRSCGATRPTWTREGFEFVAADGSVRHHAVRRARSTAVLRRPAAHPPAAGAAQRAGRHQVRVPQQRRTSTCTTRRRSRLFERDRRDFSHGCIRVEDPLRLALFVLEDQPDWTEERIRKAMEGDKMRTPAARAPRCR